ncbi:MAG: hypothetical protein AAGD05_02215, partial [Bacteroidota bacterium]
DRSGQQLNTAQYAADEISRSELNYYQDLQQNEKITSQLKDAKDWLTTLKSAHQTYQKLQSVLSEASGQAPEEIEQEGLESIWQNAQNVDYIYSELQKRFDIPEAQSREFARRGRKTLSDWAQFIEENQN